MVDEEFRVHAQLGAMFAEADEGVPYRRLLTAWFPLVGLAVGRVQVVCVLSTGTKAYARFRQTVLALDVVGVLSGPRGGGREGCGSCRYGRGVNGDAGREVESGRQIGLGLRRGGV